MTTGNAVTLPVEGMSCNHCAERVTKVLEGTEGVSQDGLCYSAKYV